MSLSLTKLTPHFRSALCLTIVMLCLLPGCVSNPLRWDMDNHVVQNGESLAMIAHHYEVTVRDLVAWNALSNPDLIKAGQKLRISRPQGWQHSRPQAPAATVPPKVASTGPIKWFWPAKGTLVPQRNSAGVGDGINIASDPGAPIFAAAPGKVVYSGNGLSGYGNLLIIKHDDTYLSAYGYNQKLLVAEGETVKGGQRVASMGIGPGKRAMLHFEIRHLGKPTNPLKYLSEQ